MRRLAARYIAGEELADAIRCLESVRAQGFAGVLDILGEDVEGEAAARAALAGYRAGVDALAASSLDAYVSVKPTHFGLRSDPALAYALYSELCAHAASRGQFVRVEMEDHTTTDATLDLFRRLRDGRENVGLVLQSRLLRTPEDIQSLDGRTTNVRLVKGVYLEPPSIAHTEPQAIRDAYVECARMLFQRGHFVAFATHDEHMAARVLRDAKDRGVPDERYDFEVLLGVQEPLWKRWRDAGHRVRVYVPFGPEWRAYSQRRLRRNPEMLRHVMRNLLARRR